MKLLIGNYIINTDAIAWVDMAHTWRTDRHETVAPRHDWEQATFRLAYDTHSGIQ